MRYNKLIPELYVRDMEASLAFYKTCGFTVAYDRTETGFAFIERGEIQMMLQEMPGTSEWGPKELPYPAGEGLNFQLEVENMQEVYEACVSKGFSVFHEPCEEWYRQGELLLGNREFLIRDPDGYLLRFFEDLGEKPAAEDAE